jgi:hypothetical protein
VGGELEVDASSHVSLPMLMRAGGLTARLEQFGLAAPRLESVGDLNLELWDTTPELGALESFQTGFIRISGGAEPGLPAKLSAEEMLLIGLGQDADLRGWTLECLELNMFVSGDSSPEATTWLYLPSAPKMLISSRGSSRLEVVAPAELDEVYVALHDETSVHGLNRATVLWLTGGGVEFPDLQSVGELTLRGERWGDSAYFELPELRWVDELVVEDWTPLVEWPKLSEVPSVHLKQTAELPTIERVDVLIDDSGSSLTALVNVGSMTCSDTQLPKLLEAESASGRCLAPSLKALGDGEGLEGCPECLPSLQFVDGDLTLTGGDVTLPQLRQTEGMLTLDGVGDFWAPALMSIGGMLVTGEGNTILESSVPGNIHVQEGAPSEAVTWATVQESLTMLGTDKVQAAPPLTVKRLTGNFYMNAPMWRSLDEMSLEEVDGNARWCLKWIEDQAVQNWLSDTMVGGVAEQQCAG